MSLNRFWRGESRRTRRKKPEWSQRPIRTKQTRKLPVARETRVTTSRSILVLHLIGWEIGANFLDQSQTVVRQNQSNHGLLSTLNWNLLLLSVMISLVLVLRHSIEKASILRGDRVGQHNEELQEVFITLHPYGIFVSHLFWLTLRIWSKGSHAVDRASKEEMLLSSSLSSLKRTLFTTRGGCDE